MNNTALERTLQKVRNQKDIKLMTTDKKKKEANQCQSLSSAQENAFPENYW